MMMGAMLKRAKRTLRNMEAEFLDPLIHKVAHRYMQFDTERYPVADYRFRVHGALGAQAREFEIAQLTQLMQSTPPNSPAYYLLLKGVIKNYNLEDKDELIQLADGFLQQSLNPPEPEPDFEEQVKLQAQALREKEFMYKLSKGKMEEVRSKLEVEAEAERDRGEAIWNQSEAVLNVEKAQTERMKAEADTALKFAQAAERLAAGEERPVEYLEVVEAIKASFSTATDTMQREIRRTMQDSLGHLSNRQMMFPPPGSNGMQEKLDQLIQQGQGGAPPQGADREAGPMQIERGRDGRVVSIGGQRVTRGDGGELSGVE
jgi:hypothetical protein